MTQNQVPRVWLKAFWGFDPGNEGYLGFTRPGDRERFIEQAQPDDLVLIYGANAPETAASDRRQALGFLEIVPVPISDRDRLSPEGLTRKIANGWEERWTYAVPVKRAWKVTRPIEVKHLAPDTYTPAYARVIASRGELMKREEARHALRLPVLRVSVFGEPANIGEQQTEASLQAIFAPSRGINPIFGPRTSEYEDREHFLYMLQLSGEIIPYLLGRSALTLQNKILIKVNLSLNIFNIKLNIFLKLKIL